MANNLIIARREIIAVKKGTTSKINITAEIFLPQPTEDGNDCFCLARFNGINGESYNTGGIDSLQALSLAISKIKSRFKDLSKEYNFYWPKSNEPMESIDYGFIIEKFSHLSKKDIKEHLKKSKNPSFPN